MSNPSPQEALIYLMVIMSAADRDMPDEELARIGSIVRTLPVFRGFDEARTLDVARHCQQRLQTESLDGMLTLIRQSIPESLHETAYALAVDIAAADLKVGREETRMLDLIKDRMKLDPLAVAALERAASIRHRELTAHPSGH